MENEFSLNKTCRTCAQSFNCNLKSPFGPKNIQLFRVLENKHFNLKISKNDGLPQKVCNNCLEELIKIYDFFLKCEKSEQLLYQRLNELENVEILLELSPHDELKSEISSEYDQSCEIDVLPISFLLREDSFTSETEKKTKNNATKLAKVIKEESNCESTHRKTIKKPSRISKSKVVKEELEESDEVFKELEDNVYDIKKVKIKSKLKTIKPADYDCSICGKIFKTFIKLRKHKKTHQTKRKICKASFLCDLCGKEFTRQESWQDHSNAHLGIKPYKCEICEKEFSVKNAFRSHVVKHSKSETFKCEICGKTFQTKGYYQEHFKRHERGILLENNEKPYKCPHCPNSFKLLSTLTNHCNYHSKPSDRKYHCSECNTNFKRSDRLKEHINGVHLKIFPFKCDLCPKAFVTGAIRNAHVRKLHSGKRHKCDICEKDFALHASLKRHKRSHNNDKRYICEVCNMSFLAVYQIEKHLETHKIDETMKNKLITQTYEEITRMVVDVTEK